MHQVTAILVGGTIVIALVGAAVVVVLIRQMREVGHLRERLSRLADGLALLTDTTEAGLSTLTRELQQAKPPRARSRRAVAGRIATAAAAGHDVPAIASREAMSESEIRLHMAMTQAGAARGAGLRIRGA